MEIGMIEMRRVVFHSGQEILQFRYVTDGLYGISGPDSVIYKCHQQGWKWSEWQNVPAVDYRGLSEAELAKATGLPTL
jgi:hypothetical protein